jgi:hypothetical protein
VRAGFAVVGALAVLVGCGGGEEDDPGSGPGAWVGLEEKARLELCAGPVKAEDGSDVRVYAGESFVGILASGREVIDTSINYAELRNEIADGGERQAIRVAEREWRRVAFRELHGVDLPRDHICRRATKLPRLGPTEILCAYDVILPFGRGQEAKDAFDTATYSLVDDAGERPYCKF